MKSPPPAPPPSKLALILLAVLLFRGHLYIASTFVGTRPPSRVPAAPAVPTDLESEWDRCAAVIASGISDIGDAGRVWLRHAFVGTNVHTPPPSLSQQQVNNSTAYDMYRCRCLIPELHAGRQPRLTAIVQSFNHHYNVANISTALKASRAIEEIVISEDGSTDGSLHDWKSALRGSSHFIIRSNNLHELRSYNRAMRMSSGDLVVLLQDDDRLPLQDTWLHDAQRLFDAIPDLGVLSGYIGQMWDYDSGQGHEFGEQRSTHGGVRGGNTKPLPFTEPVTGLPFMYAECVWIAPVFIRRSLLRKVGGLELAIAQRGEPGVWQDCVFSYEAWVNGYAVGTYSARFERGVGGHGSASSSLKLKQRERVYERAVAFTNRKYPRRRVHDAVELRNNETLKQRFTRLQTFN